MFFSTGVWDEGTTRSRTSDHRFDPIWAPFGLHFGAIGPQLGLILKVAPILIPILAQELALAGLVGFPQSSGQTRARLVKLAKQVPVVNQY